MRNLVRLSVLLFFAGVASAAPVFLARVELGPDQSAAAVAEAGVPVLVELDGFCLVKSDDAGLAGLAAASFSPTVLDVVNDEELYLYVNVRPGFDRAILSRYGTTLTSDSRGVVLAAIPASISGLNRLPVELARISLEPMVFADALVPVPPRPLPDSFVQTLVDRVSQDSVLGSIRRLQDFYTRYSTTDSCRRAVAWARQRMVDYGCDSTYLDTWDNSYAPNVVGVRRGLPSPQRIYVICGHIDNTSDYAPNHCPGSDDNASGTTGVLEACRVFADVDFDCTVWFIGFSGEEQGLLGSDDFAQRCRNRNDSIQAVINFDMISYGRQNRDTFEVIGKRSNPDCAWLVDSFIANAHEYTSLKTRRTLVNSMAGSDHHSFWLRGYVAFCGIENDFTPEYHSLGDTIGPLYYVNCGTNNVPMATEAIKAGVATLAKLAGATPRTGVAETRPATPTRILRVRPSVGRAPVTIELAPGRNAGARLDVYDAAGNLVRSLPAAGPTVTWDGRADSGGRAGAGIYLLRLTGAETAATARLVLAE